jgi:integrase/recombinase XerC
MELAQNNITSSMKISNNSFPDLLVEKKNQLSTRHVAKREAEVYKAIYDFQTFYENKYASTTMLRHRKGLKKFIDFLKQNSSITLLECTMNELSQLKYQDIMNYEQYLVSEMNNHRLKKCSVNKYLRSIQLLLELMKSKNLSKLVYIIPNALKANGQRCNVKISTEDISAILETIDNESRYKERNLSIVLLTMELGCRPIELIGITLQDISWTESTVQLHCIKSGQRTLKITKQLTQLLRKYKSIRNTYNVPHEYLFVNRFGEPIDQNIVYSIFLIASMRAFGEYRVNPKSLRHNYATNALDNLNDFDEVSKSLGHLHWSSTEYYVYKSTSRLLAKALPHNPAKLLNQGGESRGL